MFHLQAGVHLKEIEVLVLVDDKFNRTGGAVINSLRQRNSLFAHRLAGSFIQKRTWGFLDHFLMATLDRTFPLTQINHIAMFVAQHLNFNMARFFDKFFNEYTIVTKAGPGFILGG